MPRQEPLNQEQRRLLKIAARMPLASVANLGPVLDMDEDRVRRMLDALRRGGWITSVVRGMTERRQHRWFLTRRAVDLLYVTDHQNPAPREEARATGLAAFHPEGELPEDYRERKEKLEIAAEEARALLSDRRQFLDSADTIAAFAAEMSEFLKSSELTETKAFVRSFVKEIVVKPGRAAIVYSIPTPDDSPIGGADAAEIALNGGVMNSVRHGGPCGTVLQTFEWVVPL